MHKTSKPTTRTYRSILCSCTSNKNFKQIIGKIIVDPILKQNQKIMANIILLCTSNQQSEHFDYAVKIFERLDNRSIYLYNLMIKAFCKKDKFGYALKLFDEMRKRTISPDNYTYPFILKSIASLNLFSEGRKTHALIVKSGFEFDSFSRISLMDMYAKMGCVEVSRVLFDEMVERGVVAWNTMISGYVKCWKFENAVSIFEKMEVEGVMPDEATLVSTLSACIPLGNLELGKRVHRYMDEEVGFTVTIGSALLDMYTKCGNVDMARRFFDAMPTRNVISWTTMIMGYLNLGRLDEARKLFDHSPSRDVILWTAMINGYVQYKCTHQALTLFSEMQSSGIKPDKFTLVALLTVCASTGALEQGRGIHKYITYNKIRLDVVVGTALIDMYAKCGSIDESLQIFRQVKEKDKATWSSIIYGMAINGRTSEALELFSEMRRLGVEPDDISFIGVLTACNYGGLVEEGHRFFHDMKHIYQLDPKLEHYGCLVDLLGRAGHLDEAEDLIRSIPKQHDKNILPLWIALLGACRIHNNSEIGERLAKEILKLESSNARLLALVANIYAAGDKWDDVNIVRTKIKDPFKKEALGYSSIELSGVSYEVCQ